MSTTIDAAIIKALVEHIGGNPDDVVVGGSTETILPAIWTKHTDGDGLEFVHFTLPDGYEIKIGDAIILYNPNTIELLKIRTFYYVSDNPRMGTHSFTSFDNGTIETIEVGKYDDDTYFIPSVIFSDYDMPDNDKYGFLSFENVADCIRFIRHLLPEFVNLLSRVQQ
jgi:hypothetical protein